MGGRVALTINIGYVAHNWLKATDFNKQLIGYANLFPGKAGERGKETGFEVSEIMAKCFTRTLIPRNGLEVQFKRDRDQVSWRRRKSDRHSK